VLYFSIRAEKGKSDSAGQTNGSKYSSGEGRLYGAELIAEISLPV